MWWLFFGACAEPSPVPRPIWPLPPGVSVCDLKAYDQQWEEVVSPFEGERCFEYGRALICKRTESVFLKKCAAPEPADE